ncbi:MAG: hypothetical protein IKN59_01790 [Paludibacteraceae bacterium]|nr:hypothetical protein [Paludibacteraceae bacterium]
MKRTSEEAPIVGHTIHPEYGMLFVSRRENDEEDICVWPPYFCYMRNLSSREKHIYALIWCEEFIAKNPYFCETEEYISTWVGVTPRQTRTYIKNLLDGGHIQIVKRPDKGRHDPPAYVIVKDDPDRLEAIECWKDPKGAYEKFERELKEKRAAQRAAKAAKTGTPN